MFPSDEESSAFLPARSSNSSAHRKSDGWGRWFKENIAVGLMDQGNCYSQRCWLQPTRQLSRIPGQMWKCSFHLGFFLWQDFLQDLSLLSIIEGKHCAEPHLIKNTPANKRRDPVKVINGVHYFQITAVVKQSSCYRFKWTLSELYSYHQIWGGNVSIQVTQQASLKSNTVDRKNPKKILF